MLNALVRLSFVMGFGLASFACAGAQQMAEFEDEPVTTPDSSRFKSASNGARARISQYNLVKGPVSSPVPVLLPVDTKLLQRLHFMADSSSYSAFLPQKDLTVSVFGTRRVAVVGDSPSSQRESGAGISYSIQKTETGFQVSFKEFGANYLVSVECRKQLDERCTKPTYVLRIGQNLSVYEAE